MFLTDEDYKVVCDEDSLEVITQADTDTRQRAERIAMEEVAGYLRGRYDIKKAFTYKGESRNPMLIQITVSIALYYMAHWLPQSLGLDNYSELYENAVAWLTRVQKGTAQPDLPVYTDENGEETNASNPFRCGSMERQKYDY